MSEKSHIEDMRQAIRGDLERARARGQSVFERPASPPAAVAEAEPPPPVEPVAEPEPQTRPEPEPARRWFQFWR